jgi:N-acetyl-alpha-D-glucosaminyl L-malate synthase BshA
VGSDPSYLPMVKLAIRESDGVTAVSQYLKEETIRTFGVGETIKVIPNFVRAPEAQKSHCRDWLAPKDSAVLVHISNFRPVKRVMDVIKTFERVRKQVPARLVMVGDGPDRAEAETYCRDQGISGEVRFTGKQLDVGAVLACADLFLLPSATESFGLAALEAMSYGVPVVAAAVGGVPEVVREGVDGFLRPMGDVDGMAEAAIRILKEPGLRKRMGESARNHSLGDFAEDPVVDQYEALYEQVLNGERRSVAVGG